MSIIEQYCEQLHGIIGNLHGGMSIRLVKKKISKAYLLEIRNRLSYCISLIDELMKKI